ncbi:MAG: DMT family transporter [Alphaproteobacteria bacterium]|mgnify:CR=1 FL=1|jgi:S-adenosylmethionine uptake transporter|nr:DMT family transporter [Alphaproteobacteria bacterium]MBT5390624.1 DMT family transporter [Alphaproteobacteria bacterium]MBT5540782.1 DMT family transporter [Alphaproteobacteria bacterium]MBT5654749.1 DMT family transporter [Alphaproteobacteria bacterium]
MTAQPARKNETSPSNQQQAVPPAHNPVLSAWRWLMGKGFLQGAIWAIMICLVSNMNDVFQKFLGARLEAPQIVFFRFLFSMITLFPFMLRQGMSSFHTKRPGQHALRALVGAVALGIGCFSVTTMPLSDVVTLYFTQPLFFLPLAVIFLSEKLDSARIGATVLGFIGILVILNPSENSFNYMALLPISAAFMFAILDVLAKKMVLKESRITLLFYFALGTTLVAIIPAILVWKTPTLWELGLLVLLGIGANLIQICLFQAFSATEAVALAPFRYTELIFASLFGFILFSEVPAVRTLGGGILIIVSTLYITYHETRGKGFIMGWVRKLKRT